MKVLQQNIESVIFDGNLEEINRRLTALQEELLRLANERKSYSAVADEIDALREQREKCMKESAAAQGIKQRIECVRDFLKSHSEELEEYDENFTRLLIESITVYEGRLIVEFKSGTQVEIKRKKTEQRESNFHAESLIPVFFIFRYPLNFSRLYGMIEID